LVGYRQEAFRVRILNFGCIPADRAREEFPFQMFAIRSGGRLSGNRNLLFTLLPSDEIERSSMGNDEE
jgi:hypothetical protein